MTPRLVVPLLLLPLLVACAPAAAPAKTAADASSADASATLACRHFRNVLDEIDLMTDTELREKIKEVAKSGQLSESDGIAESSRALLAATTADDGEAFLAQAGNLATACAAAGA